MPLHPALFGVLYVLTSFRQIFPFAGVGELFKYLALTLLLILAVQTIIHRLYRDRFKGAILVSLFVVPFCFFGDLRAELQKSLADTDWIEIISFPYLPMAVVCAAVVLGGVVIRARRTFSVLNNYLNVLSTVMIVVTLVQIMLTPAVPEVPVGKKAHTPLALPQNPPDVYYILTDAYTSAESLEKYWGYDNSPFIDALKQKGFQVLKNAHGNADFTTRCLATYLNMDYPPKLSASFSLAAQVKYLCKIIQVAEAPARFKASGYEVTALSLFAVGDEPRYYVHTFPGIGSTSFGEFLGYKTAAGYLHLHWRETALAEINLNIFSRISEIAREKSDRPKFVYAHLMMPHEPFLFDRHGNRVEYGTNEGVTRKTDYLEQLIYENSLLTNVVSEILNHSKTPPIIIIQGDHGFRHLPDEQRKAESTTILNALHLPGANEDWLYDGMTPVNTFRMIFNRYFGENYEYLPDTVQLYLNADRE